MDDAKDSDAHRDDQASTRSDEIRAAALVRFAAYGIHATSLRDVAREAGVSIGLIQHHFGNKGQLVEAVDQHVLQVLEAAVTGPLPQRFNDPASEQGHRVKTVVTQHSAEVNYLVHAFLAGRPLGSQVFDLLAHQGIDRWSRYETLGITKPETDTTWAALNLLLLFFGAVTLRDHLERHLPDSLTTPEQLHRWERSVNKMIREGMLESEADVTHSSSGQS